jgi:poly-D-alanine transfer protein DltD
MLERAALADPNALFLFGRSELWTGGKTEPANLFFQSEPTGFWVNEIGQKGTDSLFFLETAAALGGELKGHKVAISLSLNSFYITDQTRTEHYAGNFSPRIAGMVAFDTTISWQQRQYLAQRMLNYPSTLRDFGMLRVALVDLADDSPINRLSYALIYPLGRIQLVASQLNESRLLLDYASTRDLSRHRLRTEPRFIDWQHVLTTTTDEQRRAAANDPFGADPSQYDLDSPDRERLLTARTRYYQGLNNRDTNSPNDARSFALSVQASVERTDIQHEIAVLQEIGAIPMVISRPEDGVVSDYSVSPTSSRAMREGYYDLIVSDLAHANITFVSYAEHDEDPFFLLAASDHFGRRGWLFVDRALDLFWHGASSRELANANGEMDTWSPSPTLPLPPVTATVTQRLHKEAVQPHKQAP